MQTIRQKRFLRSYLASMRCRACKGKGCAACGGSGDSVRFKGLLRAAATKVASK